jgi:hypothetical protein
MRYAMLICGDDDAWQALTPQQEEDAMKEVFEWLARWQPTGKIADGGAELQHKSTAKTIRRTADGARTVTDGPYMELKEVIGGLILLECDSIDEAVAVASDWPLSSGTDSIEIRPVMVR